MQETFVLFFVFLPWDTWFFAHNFCIVCPFGVKFGMKVHVVVVDIEFFFQIFQISLQFSNSPDWMSLLAILEVYSPIFDPKMQIQSHKLDVLEVY